MRSRSGKLGLVVASLVFTFVVLEIVARVSHLGTGAFWEPHPLYGWRNIPNAVGWESCYGECAVYVEINSNGLRDREIAYATEADEKRILILGDSLTTGMQVSLEQTFAKVLEQRLAQIATDNPWVVINAGVNGFGTDNELLFFREEAVKYKPDIVVLAVYLANDVYNNNRELEVRLGGIDHKPYFTLSEHDELVLHNYPVTGTDSLSIRTASFLRRHFQLPRFIAQTFGLRRRVPPALQPLVQLVAGQRAVRAAPQESQGNEKPATICESDYVPVIEDAWAVTKALIRQLRSEVEATNARFAVVMIPAAPQLTPPLENADWYCDQPNQELSNFLSAEGIPYLDLLEPFRQHVLQDGDLLYYMRDFHLNEEGHRLAGEALEQFIRNNDSTLVGSTNP